MKLAPLVLWLIWAVTISSGQAEERPNLNLLPADLVVPAVRREEPSAGRRVEAVTDGWQATQVHHALYLPPGWKANGKLPVLVEFPGNGNYRNDLGDQSDGTIEGCLLGYGLSGGEGFIWVSMPFVQIDADGTKRNCSQWWGEISETKRYCAATVREVCARYGGDASRVVLCGFSRGAIACNYIGLHDDEIATLWRAFFCHSHYDGVRKWPHADSDVASAAVRLRRLASREQWISHEGSVELTRTYLQATGVQAPFTFTPIPFPNHSAAWVLRDLPERQQARAWLARVLR